MDLDVRDVDGVTVATALGQSLDAERAPSFREQVGALVDGGADRLVLDLSDLRFIDSSGLGALVSALRRTGGRVCLVLDTDDNAVMDVIRITRMHRVFDIYPSVAEAVAGIKGV